MIKVLSRSDYQSKDFANEYKEKKKEKKGKNKFF